MVTIHTHSENNKKRSALEKFQLGFEYDRTWHEAKQSVQLRPSKKSRIHIPSR